MYKFSDVLKDIRNVQSALICHYMAAKEWSWSWATKIFGALKWALTWERMGTTALKLCTLLQPLQ